MSGVKAETVLERSETKIFIKTAINLTLFSILAFIIWLCTMKIQGLLLAKVPIIKEKNWAILRTMWCILVYSWFVIQFNGYFGKKAAKIVFEENHKYTQDHEEGMIQKSYFLGFVNSYLGMSVAAFFDGKLTGVAMLLSVVLAAKQFIMNLMKLRAP